MPTSEAGVSSKSRNRQSKAAPTPSRTVREQKRAQFEGKRSNTKLHIALAAGALVIVAVIAAVVVMNRGGAQAATATAASSGSGDITLPVAQVNDGKAHFYTYDANGTTVKYFVLASKDGTVRAALDACEVCYPKKLGYHQVGDSMQCNNCGKKFRSDQINVVTGGCNPIPLTRSVSGDTLTIQSSSLQAGAQYFQ
jgi:uncharacterized membrane protein